MSSIQRTPLRSRRGSVQELSSKKSIIGSTSSSLRKENRPLNKLNRQSSRSLLSPSSSARKATPPVRRFNSWNASKQIPSTTSKHGRSGMSYKSSRKLSSVSSYSTGSGESAAGFSTVPSAKSRKTLKNENSDENVRVMVRVRPPFANERNCVNVVQGNKTLFVGDEDRSNVFTFDHVFGPDCNQDSVFLNAGKPVAEYALEGFNGCIFVYGQTGSGKTYTMNNTSAVGDGSSDNRGIVPRMLDFCFAATERLRSEGAKVLVRCSVVEIYNENIFDLLDPETKANINSPGFAPKPKQIREGVKCGVFVEGLTEIVIHSPEEATKLLKEGESQRRVATTQMNDVSSRSHSIFTLNLEIKQSSSASVNSNEESELFEVTKYARISLVDLAGSERQRDTAAKGDRLLEAKHINKSLSAFGNVIQALVDRSQGKSRHIPYRNSILTYLLKDSLGGNTRTSIITTITPDEKQFQETISTLKFGQRAKMIKSEVIANTDLSGADVNKLHHEIKMLREQVKLLSEKEKLRLIPISPTRQHQKGTEISEEAALKLLVTEESKLLQQDKDFENLEKRVEDALTSKRKRKKPKSAGVLLDRIFMLERVLVELLHDLRDKRSEIDKLDGRIKQKDESIEVIQTALQAKELIMELQEQKINQLSNNDVDDQGVSEALTEAKDIIKETESGVLIYKLQSEVQSMKHILSTLGVLNHITFINGNAVLQPENEKTEALIQELEKSKRKQYAAESQLETTLIDKAELERTVRELNDQQEKRMLELKEQEELLISASTCAEANPSDKIAKLEKELESERLRIQKLEDEMFLNLENEAKDEELKQDLINSTTKAKMFAKSKSKRLSALDASSLPHLDLSERLASTPKRKSDIFSTQEQDLSQITRAMMLVTAQAQRNSVAAQNLFSSAVDEQVARGNDTEDNNVDKTRLGVKNGNNDQQINVPKEISLLRNALMRLENENGQLKIQLDQRKNKARQTRRESLKEIGKIQKEADSEQIKVLSLENQVLSLKANNEQLLLTNKELGEAVESANAYAEFSKNKCVSLKSEVEALKNKLKIQAAEMKAHNMGGANVIMKPPRSRTIPRGSSVSTTKEYHTRQSTMTVPEFDNSSNLRQGRMSSMSTASDASSRTALISSFVGEDMNIRKISTSPPRQETSGGRIRAATEIIDLTGNEYEDDNIDGTGTPVASKTTSVAEFFPPTPSNSNTAIAKKKASVVLNRSQSFTYEDFNSAAHDSDTVSTTSKTKTKRAGSMRRLTNILRWQR